MLRGASKLVMSSLTPPFLLLSPRHLSLRHSRFCLSFFFSSSSQAPRLSSISRSRTGFSIRASNQVHNQTDFREDYLEPNGGYSPDTQVLSHPWPEWSRLVENLRNGGYFNREMAVAPSDDDDAFSGFNNLPQEFVQAANACLVFARERPDLLSLLSRRDIEVVVENGSAFLFRNGMNSTKRLKSFLGGSGNDVLEFERPCTVDVVRFLLSYSCSPLVTSENSSVNNRGLVETSVRNLLNELAAHMSGMVKESGLSGPTPRQFPGRYAETPRPFGQNIEMKRGDWICPSCSFMNFARNLKCLECNEARPKMQLTGGEWECPQCDFFNYGRNAVCLRCDCKRPGETPLGVTGPRSGLGYGRALNGTNSNNSDIESRLAANDEKAERWFSKVSQLNNGADMSSAIADEDFPEIMPLRKGVNRFVVSTRKTPLERRLENAQYRRNLGNSGSPEGGNDFQAGNVDGATSAKNSSSISQSLDRILGRSSAVPETDKSMSEKTDNLSATGTEERFSSSQYRQSVGNQGSNSGHVPFVPLPADMFAKPQNSKTEVQAPNGNNVSVKGSEVLPGSVSQGPVASAPPDSLKTSKLENPTQMEKEREQAEKSERWFKKVAELHDVTDLASAIPDEDFPEIMPMRKGENRFVVSKKKDRSLTSPQNKRRLAMEQANSSNFVPFVPFPPDYFAKKDKQPEAGAPTEKAASVTLANENSARKSEIQQTNGAVENLAPKSDNQQTNGDKWSSGFSANSLNSGKVNAVYGGDVRNSTQQPENLQPKSGDSWNSGTSVMEGTTGSLPQRSENTPSQQFTGKSLEGSLVKEPDPLDMSEEAKAERWFRRVAQIKDISELSQIPDEDFPSIMPMRKGVNRFVVSKRKTPLERRLTSPQYRRNLPIVSSDPAEKKDSSS